MGSAKTSEGLGHSITLYVILCNYRLLPTRLQGCPCAYCCLSCIPKKEKRKCYFPLISKNQLSPSCRSAGEWTGLESAFFSGRQQLGAGCKPEPLQSFRVQIWPSLMDWHLKHSLCLLCCYSLHNSTSPLLPCINFWLEKRFFFPFLM